MKKLVRWVWNFWNFLSTKESDPVLDVKKRRFIAVVNAPVALIWINLCLAGLLLVAWATDAPDIYLLIPIVIPFCVANAVVLAFLVWIEYRRWKREKENVADQKRQADAVFKDATERLKISRQLLEAAESKPGAPRMFLKKDK